MRQIVGNNYGSYSFNPIAKTVTIAGILDVLTVSNISLITNIKTNTIIYEPDVVGKECTVVDNIITLTYDTSLMEYSDPLQIIIEIPNDSIAEMRIVIPTFNFDLKQGQDLTIPMTYTMSNVPDSMVNSTVRMRVVLPGTNKTIIDNLDNTNDRISVIGVNKFNITFPSAVTMLYKIPVEISELLHGVYLITPSKTLVVCEGVINFQKSNLFK